MSDLTQIIKERRSIRKFKPDAVPKGKIEQIVEAGLYAPSGKGLQSSKIIVVTNKELRDQISEENRKIGGWEEGFDPFYGAPVILLVVAEKSVPTAIYDGSLTMGTMLLKTHELGLGGIWIHRAKQELESDFGKALLQRLGIREELEGIGHLALGYIDGENPSIPDRKPNRVFYAE